MKVFLNKNSSPQVGIINLLVTQFVFIFFTLLTMPSYAKVIIAPEASTEETILHFDIGPGKYVAIPLPSSNKPDDSYTFKIYSKNKVYKDITTYLVDQKNLQLFQKSQTYKGIGYSRTKTPLSIKGSTNTIGKKYLVLDNTYAKFITKKIDISFKAKLPINEKKAEALKERLTGLYNGIRNTLKFKDFDIHVRPCGQVNAYSESNSTGNIHICTELLDNISKSNNTGALAFIILHELGHSLLGLWKLPGNNNEDIADEFATYLMLMGGAKSGIMLERSLDFWRNRDSKVEALNMIKNGDRHSLSIQRIRNIEENIRNNKEFSKRWSVLIYPHMTEQALESIIEQPPENANIALAKSILKKQGRNLDKDINVTSSNATSTESITNRLEKIKKLHQKGLITEEEYNTKRQSILDEL